MNKNNYKKVTQNNIIGNFEATTLITSTPVTTTLDFIHIIPLFVIYLKDYIVCFCNVIFCFINKFILDRIYTLVYSFNIMLFQCNCDSVIVVAYSFALLYNIAFHEYIKIHLFILLSMYISNISHFSCYYKQDSVHIPLHVSSCTYTTFLWVHTAQL